MNDTLGSSAFSLIQARTPFKVPPQVDGSTPDTKNFQSFTTFPMALSPHFGAVIASKIHAMWSADLVASEAHPALYTHSRFLGHLRQSALSVLY